jgi:hypothetical protein
MILKMCLYDFYIFIFLMFEMNWLFCGKFFRYIYFKKKYFDIIIYIYWCLAFIKLSVLLFFNV